MNIKADTALAGYKRRAPHRLVAGIDLGGTKVDVALVDLDGRTTASKRIATDAMLGAASVIDRALNALDDLLTDGQTIAAIGVGVPGVVHGHQVSMAPNLPGLDSLNLVELIGMRFKDAKIIVVNDLNAAAAAELHGGALDGVDTALVIGLGTGIATGVIVGGELRKGASGAAGEIGHVPVSLLPEIIRDALDGRTPTLEEVVGGGALNLLALSLSFQNTAELLDRAASEEWVGALVLPRLHVLVSVLCICCHLLSPERLVFFGGLASHPYLQSFVTEELLAQLALPVEIIWAQADDNAALRGAVRQASLILEADLA